jgi:hypothetical protein
VLLFPPVPVSHQSHHDLFADCRKTFNNLCKSLSDVYAVDLEEIAGKIGKEQVYDPHETSTEQLPFTLLMIQAAAARVVRMSIQIISGRP